MYVYYANCHCYNYYGTKPLNIFFHLKILNIGLRAYYFPFYFHYIAFYR